MKQRELEHDCAATFLNSMRGMDPTWDAKIQALIEEMHLNETQALGSLCAFALDTDQYLIVPDHPFFHGDNIPAKGTKLVCPICDHEFERQYPGQPVCSNECAEKFYAQKPAA